MVWYVVEEFSKLKLILRRQNARTLDDCTSETVRPFVEFHFKTVTLVTTYDCIQVACIVRFHLLVQNTSAYIVLPTSPQ